MDGRGTGRGVVRPRSIRPITGTEKRDQTGGGKSVEEGGAVRAVDDLGTKYVIQHPGYSILFYTRSTKRTNRPNQTSRPSPNRARAPHPLTPHVPYPLPAVHIPPTHPEPYPIFFPHDLTGLQRRRRRRFAEVGRRRERRRRSPAAVALEDPPPQAPPAPLLLLRHPARSQGGAGGQLGVSRLQWFTAWKVQPRWRWRVLADSPRTHTGSGRIPQVFILLKSCDEFQMELTIDYFKR